MEYVVCLVFEKNKLKNDFNKIKPICTYISMDEKELLELYKIIKRAYDESCWNTVHDAIDYISDYVDVDEDLSENE